MIAVSPSGWVLDRSHPIYRLVSINQVVTFGFYRYLGVPTNQQRSSRQGLPDTATDGFHGGVMGEKWVPGLAHLLSQGTQRPSPTLHLQPPICSPATLVPKIFVLTASPIFIASQRSGCLPALIPGPSFHGW